MPFILFIIGVVVSVFAAYHFFRKATRKQIATLIIILGTVCTSGLILLLAITGRLPAIVGGIAAFAPLLYSVWQSHKKVNREEKIYRDLSGHSRPMTIKEALDVLGLSQKATAEDIEKAHKRLLLKLHPDMQGSEWIAQKINQARDTLLKGK
jgi:L-lactate permease